MKRVIRQRAKYYVPVRRGHGSGFWVWLTGQMTEWLPNYSWSLFSGDLIAGTSLACLLIPQVSSDTWQSGSSLSLVYFICQWSSQIIAHSWSMVGRDSSIHLWNSRNLSVCMDLLAYIWAVLTYRQLSLGPEAALSLLIGQMVSEQVYGDPHTRPSHPELEAAAIAVITTFQVGVAVVTEVVIC